MQNMAIAMANDSGSLTLALEYDAAVIAAGCVFLAIKAQTNAKPYKIVKVAKWYFFSMTHKALLRLLTLTLLLYYVYMDAGAKNWWCIGRMPLGA